MTTTKGRRDAKTWEAILARTKEIGASAAAKEFKISSKAIYNKLAGLKARTKVKRKYTRRSTPVQTIIAAPRASSKAMVVVCEVSDLSRIIAEMQNA